ncbi:MAG: sigma-54-dependent Fis family transcriptional regulator [Bacteroidales bacterium]|nr:sigma-54-dependent Fis family transcriptional regulator [Bacteroidales bacterium]
MEKLRILIADDDEGVRSSLRLLLHRSGFETVMVPDAAGAIDVVRSETHLDLALIDMNFTRATSGDEGLVLLRQIKIFRPDLPVILMTAWATIALAVKGVQAGAVDFVSKPWDNRGLLQQLRSAIEVYGTRHDADGDAGFDRSGIIGESPRMLEIIATLKKIAPTDASVLIMGENGTGKELIAQAVHRNSPRRDRPFVKVNLGGMPSTLFESEMFGHKKGAFTGAVSDRPGRFAAADTGTIFLDEIGDLDMASQVKMLRVLQEHTYERLGDDRPRHVDVRVVCATNADLPSMVADRAFREDLFYRINLITIELPPLRERREDIPELVRHFARQNADENGGKVAHFDDGAMALLQKLPYPGNIRELKNLVRKCVLLVGKETISADDILPLIPPAGLEAASQESTFLPDANALDNVQCAAIKSAMQVHGGNLSRVAASLGITRQTLYRRMEKYHIDR